MKFPVKLLFPILMAFFMSLIMSAVVTLINFGLTAQFPLMWIRAFAVSFVVAVPTAMFVAPLVQKIVANIEAKQS